MSLAAVGFSLPQARAGVRDSVPDDGAGLFDLLAAAAASQVSMTTVAAEPAVSMRAPDSITLEAGAVARDTARDVLVIAGTETQVAFRHAADSPPPQASAPSVSISPGHKPDATLRTQDSMTEPTFFVNHGTLPVIVAGQLVELTVLCELRSMRDTGTRRMSMSLDTTSNGPVRIEARLERDRLIVRLEGMGPEETSHASYAREVEALARRIGWQFSHAILEEAA
jgi:hypothetical protein